MTKEKKHLVIHVATARKSLEDVLMAGAIIDAVTFTLRIELFALVLLGKLLTCAGLGSIYFARFETDAPHNPTLEIPLPNGRKRKTTKE